MRTITWIAGPLLGLVVALGALTAYRLANIAGDLRSARDLIDHASAAIDAGRLRDAREDLAVAQRILVDTNTRLYGSTDIELIGRLPFASDNLTSLRTSVGIALEMVTGGNELLDITRPLENAQGNLEVRMHAGAVPLDAITSAQRQVHAMATSLPGQRQEPSSDRLVPAIRDLQHRIYREAGRRRDQLDNVGRALDLLGDMAGASGPRRYLIAVANTAEMRGAGGMILSYGVLQSSAGTFTLGNFGNVDELFLDQRVDPSTLNLPPGFVDRWAGFEPTRLWRNATLSPDFTIDAPILEALYTKSTGLPVDGVIQIDPHGLAAILTGTGPIQVDTVGTVSADNVVDLTLNRAYVDFPNRDQRQDVLGDVAKGAFNALVDGQYESLRPFGAALFKAAAGRHLLLYANSNEIESEARYFGADGSLPPPEQQDVAVLTVQNLSSNKLDYFVDTSLALTGRRPGRRSGELTADITVANSAPAQPTSTYVFGPNRPTEQAGLYRGLVSLYLPQGVGLANVGGDPTTTPVAMTAESGHSVVTFVVELRQGEQRHVSVQLSLSPRPAGPYSLSLVPTGRVRPTVVSVDIATDQGRVSRTPFALAAPVVVSDRR